MVSRFVVSACSPASPSCPAFVTAFSRLHFLSSSELIVIASRACVYSLFCVCSGSLAFALFPWLCFVFLAFALLHWLSRWFPGFCVGFCLGRLKAGAADFRAVFGAIWAGLFLDSWLVGSRIVLRLPLGQGRRLSRQSLSSIGPTVGAVGQAA